MTEEKAEVLGKETCPSATLSYVLASDKKSTVLPFGIRYYFFDSIRFQCLLH